MTTEETFKSERSQTMLLEAMASIGYIQKDKKNTFGQGYKYLSEKAVKEAVQAALIKAEVMPTSIRFDILEDMVRPVGKRDQNIIKLRAVITFPGGYVFEGLGGAADVSDKALMQAQTSAIREAWKNVFCIPSGDDPEQKTPGNEPEEKQETPQKKPSARAKREPVDSLKGSAGEQPGSRTKEQRVEIIALIREDGAMSLPAASAYVQERWGCKPDALNAAQAVLFIAHLKGLVKS